ncbi:MAG: NAD-dependent epimerase/dehydratase family protein [Dokdonella sp.]
MAIPSSRILLTGSRGFTGRYLRDTLVARGYDVVGLINEGQPEASERVADITNASAMRDLTTELMPDYVIHLAAITFVPHSDVSAIYATNTMGTLNLLESLAALPRRPRRVILASSANVYGNADYESIDEDVLPAPLNHYAASKLAMEAVASVFRERLPYVITRPFNYTGPGQASHFLVPKIVQHFAARAERIELGNLDIERDFLDVRSVSSIYARLLDCVPAEGNVVNVCSGRGTTLRAIIAKLEKITGHTMEVTVNPEVVRASDIKRLVGTNFRLRSLVGEWQDYELDQTLRGMLVAAERKAQP